MANKRVLYFTKQGSQKKSPHDDDFPCLRSRSLACCETVKYARPISGSGSFKPGGSVGVGAALMTDSSSTTSDSSTQLRS